MVPGLPGECQREVQVECLGTELALSWLQQLCSTQPAEPVGVAVPWHP